MYTGEQTVAKLKKSRLSLKIKNDHFSSKNLPFVGHSLSKPIKI